MFNVQQQNGRARTVVRRMLLRTSRTPQVPLTNAVAYEQLNPYPGKRRAKVKFNVQPQIINAKTPVKPEQRKILTPAQAAAAAAEARISKAKGTTVANNAYDKLTKKVAAASKKTTNAGALAQFARMDAKYEAAYHQLAAPMRPNAILRVAARPQQTTAARAVGGGVAGGAAVFGNKRHVDKKIPNSQIKPPQALSVMKKVFTAKEPLAPKVIKKVQKVGTAKEPAAALPIKNKSGQTGLMEQKQTQDEAHELNARISAEHVQAQPRISDESAAEQKPDAKQENKKPTAVVARRPMLHHQRPTLATASKAFSCKPATASKAFSCKPATASKAFSCKPATAAAPKQQLSNKSDSKTAPSEQKPKKPTANGAAADKARIWNRYTATSRPDNKANVVPTAAAAADAAAAAPAEFDTSKVLLKRSLEFGVQTNEPEILNHDLLVGDMKVLFPSKHLIEAIELERRELQKQQQEAMLKEERKFEEHSLKQSEHLTNLKEFLETGVISKRAKKLAEEAMDVDEKLFKSMDELFNRDVPKAESFTLIQKRIKSKQNDLMSLFDTIDEITKI